MWKLITESDVPGEPKKLVNMRTNVVIKQVAGQVVQQSIAAKEKESEILFVGTPEECEHHIVQVLWRGFLEPRPGSTHG